MHRHNSYSYLHLLFRLYSGADTSEGEEETNKVVYSRNVILFTHAKCVRQTEDLFRVYHAMEPNWGHLDLKTQIKQPQ